MFTGLVEEVGVIKAIQVKGQGFSLNISCKKILDDLKIGDSVNISGACLTVTSCDGSGFTVDVVRETAARTMLNGLRPGSKINLERSLRPNDRIGGHFVQGHVDAVGRIVGQQTISDGLWLTVELPKDLIKYTVEKGSIALDGVSLTIAKVAGREVSIAIIPHTGRVTTLGDRVMGDLVNVEVDLLGKYVERLKDQSVTDFKLTIADLENMGF